MVFPIGGRGCRVWLSGTEAWRNVGLVAVAVALMAAILVVSPAASRARSGVGDPVAQSNGGSRTTCEAAPEVFKLLCDVYGSIARSYLDPWEPATLATRAAPVLLPAGPAAPLAAR